MWAILGCMFSGILVGWLLRSHPVKQIPHVLMFLVCLLLFIMGIEVGSNPLLLEGLPRLGGQAFVLAAFCTLGSMLAAMLFGRYLHKQRER